MPSLCLLPVFCQTAAGRITTMSWKIFSCEWYFWESALSECLWHVMADRVSLRRGSRWCRIFSAFDEKSMKSLSRNIAQEAKTFKRTLLSAGWIENKMNTVLPALWNSVTFPLGKVLFLFLNNMFLVSQLVIIQVHLYHSLGPLVYDNMVDIFEIQVLTYTFF